MLPLIYESIEHLIKTYKIIREIKQYRILNRHYHQEISKKIEQLTIQSPILKNKSILLNSLSFNQKIATIKNELAKTNIDNSNENHGDLNILMHDLLYLNELKQHNEKRLIACEKRLAVHVVLNFTKLTASVLSIIAMIYPPLLIPAAILLAGTAIYQLQKNPKKYFLLIKRIHSQINNYFNLIYLLYLDAFFLQNP